MRFETYTWMICALGVVLCARLPVRAETHWEIQAVDTDGIPTHPKVGADPTDPNNKVVVEGIALNNPAEILASSMWQVYVQGEGEDHAGTAVFSAMFFNPTWPEYTSDIYPGDRVRVTGFIAGNAGKTNINERHSGSPAMNFVIEVLQAGAGMPEPELIPSVADCNFFQQDRLAGGEWYQARWTRLNNVWIDSGTWANGQQITIADETGTVTMLLSGPGDFGDYPAPQIPFDVIGMFDQEDGTSPYTDSYRMWAKRFEHILPHTATSDMDLDGDVDGFDFLTFSNCYNGSNRSPLEACENAMADLERDGDVDGFDFLTFANCYNGSGNVPIPEPNCTHYDYQNP